MAVDSRDKRSAAIQVALPWRAQLPTSDGVIGQANRIHTGFHYPIDSFMSLAITAISPTSAPNDQVLTVMITGTFNTPSFTVWLSKSGQQNRFAKNVVKDNETQLTAKFDLRKLAAGNWTLNVNDGVSTATL